MKKQRNIHVIAFFCALFLHGGIAIWAMKPESPVTIAQQVIKVSTVAPSSIVQEKQKSEVETKKETPKDKGMRKASKKEDKKKQDEKKEVTSKENPTSGPESQNALDKTAAHSEPVFDAAYLNNPAPAYPQSARKKGVEGKVLIEVLVSAEGKASSVLVADSSGSNLLDEAALKAVRSWKFIPAKQSGEIVEAKVIVPVEFKLN